MDLINDKIIAALQSLVEICRDGNQGFKDAGDDVKDKRLREQMHEFSEQRMNFSIELKDIVESSGGDINLSGTILGSLHRRWMDIRFGVIGTDTEGILKECLRGEKTALQKYENALSIELPDDIRKVVERQYSEINKVVETIHKMIETNRYSAASN